MSIFISSLRYLVSRWNLSLIIVLTLRPSGLLGERVADRA